MNNMIDYLDLNIGPVEATTGQKFLALAGSETFLVELGVVRFFRGLAEISVGPIERGEYVDLSHKENAQYQEWIINENSI
jgi:hypothetical protein